MTIPFFKYQGTGNDFIMIDNRLQTFPKNDTKLIATYCDRRFGVGADGLILLENDISSDFNMIYYNSDGQLGSMCGNGGRCAVAFAQFLGIIDQQTTFVAADGLHSAVCTGPQIALAMNEVAAIKPCLNGYFVNTGSPHFVLLTEDVAAIDVDKEGAHWRRQPDFAPGGTNVNFVQMIGENHFTLRTFERGVEAETLSCGTGATAVALTMHHLGKTTANQVTIDVLGGELVVSFEFDGSVYTNIQLIGPAAQVFSGNLNHPI
ncbi:MAG: diaminopimelate epimerase [Flavobacterium sp. BFFFF2]|nr:MAG: diaminopimelate epimerase [Flavobacterium sp. BFFFF2]